MEPALQCPDSRERGTDKSLVGSALLPAQLTAVCAFVLHLSNQLFKYSCVLKKLDGFELVPCHSSLNRIIAVGTLRILSA